VAVVSDAGTPLISDPGGMLVAAAHDAGIRVEPIPGPSAALAAVSASGLPADQILIVGFPPSRSNDRKRWLEGLKNEPRLLVFFEAPHRIVASLSDLLEIFGDRLCAVGRELTKAHEQLVVRPISMQLQSFTEPKGEFTVVVAPAEPVPEAPVELPDAAELLHEFGDLTNSSTGSRREAVKLLARKYRVPTRTMYQMLEGERED
jgi:16S rRNA (cytidine1402-2'-O)-methyltransferase